MRSRGLRRLGGGLSAARLTKAAAALAAALLVACDLPRDPLGTLESVRSAGRLVAVAWSAPPFVSFDRGVARGIEVDLVEEFARGLGVQVEWRVAGTEEAFAALERGDAHLLVGGLDANDPWKKRVGMTRPYARVRLAHVAAGDESGVGRIGLRVLPEGEPAPEALSVEPRRLVMAVRRGENAWLVRLERFLGDADTRLAIDRALAARPGTPAAPAKEAGR